MESYLIYLLKSAGIVALFVGFYFLFLRRETHFNQNRIFLLVGLLLSLVFPLITIDTIIWIKEVSIDPNQMVASLEEDSTTGMTLINWQSLLFSIYILGILFFFARLLMQLFSLRKLISQGVISKEDTFVHVQINQDISPFSFFNHIVYNPTKYSSAELNAILIHEKIHVAQRHSIDMLLMHLFAIFQWFNPLMWWYKKYAGQNLEFIADTNTLKKGNDKKQYQYLMLKASVGQSQYSIANPFFNSLIKKRIVMLNKSKSNKLSHLKITLMVPALAFFLMSFNTRDVYRMAAADTGIRLIATDADKTLKIVIDKNTTNKELVEIKKDLADQGVDFSYTVVHNSNNEISNLSIDLVAEKENGNKARTTTSFENGDAPIKPVYITYNTESNSFSIGGNQSKVIEVHEDDDHSIWMHSNDDDEVHKTIEIIDKNGKETIKVNGKEISRKTYEAMKEEDGVQMKRIKIKKSDSGESSNIFIHSDSDDEHDIQVTSGSGNGFFFIDTEEDGEPLYFIDGKESTKKDMEKLDSSDIESIDVSKGKKAKEKFGKKGKNGVVEIKTKKN